MRKKSFYLCMIRRLFIFLFLISALLTACTDNDSFGINRGDRLTFTSDTIKFDTLFSTVPSATKTFWIHNESSDGIRIRTARLERGTQSGYRVNVDGTYLDRGTEAHRITTSVEEKIRTILTADGYRVYYTGASENVTDMDVVNLVNRAGADIYITIQ